jgi:hypothetical protein
MLITAFRGLRLSRVELLGRPTDPIAAAVDAQFQPLAQELTDLGHRLAKEK